MIGRWALNFALIAALFLIGFWQYQQTSQAQHALCTLRNDLESRVVRSRDYLDDLDTGVRDPIPGISRADIVTGIQNQERTISALNNLDC